MLQKELDRKETQLSVKDKQLAVKDEQIRELNARLAECSTALLAAQETARAAQALHAGTIQQQLSDGEDHAAASVQEKKEPHWYWFRRLFKSKYKKESVRNKYDYFGDNLYVSCWCYRSFLEPVSFSVSLPIAVMGGFILYEIKRKIDRR